MRTVQRWAIIVTVASVGCGLAAETGPEVDSGIREPAVAGQFYPATATRLRAAIGAFMRDAVAPGPERPIAIVVPHAGYIYSGQIAADAFRQAAAHHYDTVVILGTNHTDGAFTGIAIHPGSAFRTPLGDAPIDVALRHQLLAENETAVANARVHAREHSVEVQVPFVQSLFPTAKILPVVVGDVDPASSARFGRTLAKALKGRQALIVVSSDLSHYPSAANASAVDRRTLEAIAALDPARMHAVLRAQMDGRVPDLVTCACGEGPIAVAVEAATALGAARGTVISYANSADVPVGDPARVVGYGAVALTTGARGGDAGVLARTVAVDATSPLQPRDRKVLLALARDTIDRMLTTDTVPLVRTDNARLLRTNGVFVTLRQRGALRGCIGQIVGTAPLAKLTSMMALAAAFDDPRFEKLRADELPGLDLEVSVLTPLRRVASAAEIVVGRDGVLLRKSGRSAVFLPEVATEQGWNREQMLDNLCLKAGLPAGSWRTGAELSIFQAEAFSEHDLK